MSTLKVNKLRDTTGSTDAIVLDPSGGAVLAGVTSVSTVKVGSGVTISSDGDVFTTGITTSSTVIVGSGVTISESGIEASGIGITCANINGQQISGRRNIITNGAMNVAQRGTSFTGITASGTYPVDRFLFHVGSLGTWTLTQSTDVPTGQGFAKSIKCDVTTANASPSGTSYARIDQRFEGQDLQRFCKGTANAKNFAVSFWVKSPKTGTHIVQLQDQDNSRNVSKAYTVSSANTWEKKELIIDADTTGAFGNDNGKSLTVAWWLSAGTDYKSGTLATSWVSPTNANRIVGQVNVADNTANNFYLTGVQLEVGSQTTSFEHRSFGEEMSLCERYFQVMAQGDSHYLTNCMFYSNTVQTGVINFKTQMRTTPTLYQVAVNSGYVIYHNSSGDSFNSFTGGTALSQDAGAIYNSGTITGTAGHCGGFYLNDASCFIAMQSEL